MKQLAKKRREYINIIRQQYYHPNSCILVSFFMSKSRQWSEITVWTGPQAAF